MLAIRQEGVKWEGQEPSPLSCDGACGYLAYSKERLAGFLMLKDAFLMTSELMNLALMTSELTKG